MVNRRDILSIGMGLVVYAAGAAPYLSFRLAVYGVMRRRENPPAFERERQNAAAALRSFHYDVALSADPATLQLLVDVAGRDRVLFGSDHPQVPEDVLDGTAQSVVRAATENAAFRGIVRDNAVALFPRLKALD